MFGRSSPQHFPFRRRLRSGLVGAAHTACLGALAVAAMATPQPAPEGAPEGTEPTLSFTIDSGGGTSSSAAFQLTGSIGQPETGTASSPNHTLVGGFWGRTAASDIFTDGFESGDTTAWSSAIP